MLMRLVLCLLVILGSVGRGDLEGGVEVLSSTPPRFLDWSAIQRHAGAEDGTYMPPAGIKQGTRRQLLWTGKCEWREAIYKIY
jgi:hypothetical protein